MVGSAMAIDMAINHEVTLTDINQTALEKLKKSHPEIPIVAQTAYALENDRLRSLSAGCNAYLSKPINRNQIKDKGNSPNELNSGVLY